VRLEQYERSQDKYLSPTQSAQLASLRYTIGGYMELAVETFAQNQESYAVHVEVVAAPWTFT